MEMFEEYVLPAVNSLYQYVPSSLSLQAASYLAFANNHFESIRDAYLEPFILSPLKTVLNSPPDFFSILILLFLFIISLKILDYTRRVIVFWVTLAFRLVFWGTILGGAWYAYSVGWEKAARDAAWMFGLIEGFIQQLLAASGTQDGSESANTFRSRGRELRW